MGIPLTQVDPELERRVSATTPGMAYWAGTGPAAATCAACSFLVSLNRGVGTSTRCAKYAQMMNGKYGPKKLPPDTRACKYFEAKQ